MIYSLVNKAVYCLDELLQSKAKAIDNKIKPQKTAMFSNDFLFLVYLVRGFTRDSCTIDLFTARFSGNLQLTTLILARYHRKLQSFDYFCCGFLLRPSHVIQFERNTCVEPSRLANELTSLSFLSADEKSSKVHPPEPVLLLLIK